MSVSSGTGLQTEDAQGALTLWAALIMAPVTFLSTTGFVYARVERDCSNVSKFELLTWLGAWALVALWSIVQGIRTQAQLNRGPTENSRFALARCCVALGFFSLFLGLFLLVPALWLRPCL